MTAYTGQLARALDLVPTHKEMIGTSLDGLHPGAKFHHAAHRTMHHHDNMIVALLAMNTHPAHIDYDYVENSQFEGALVVSPLLLSTIIAIVLNDFRDLEFDGMEIVDLSFSVPTHPGHTIGARSKLLVNDGHFVKLFVEGVKPDDSAFCAFELHLILGAQPC